MTPVIRLAVFTISVDLAPRTASPSVREASDRAAHTILDLLAGVSMPATWAVDEAAPVATLRHISSSGADHEIAILADPTWAGIGAGRANFALELANRVGRAGAQGWETTTLALPGDCHAQQIDLAIKYGITAIRTQGVAANGLVRPYWMRRNQALTSQRPRAVHYGLWQVAATERFAPERAWFEFLAAAKVQANLDRAIELADHYHLLIDAAEFAAAGRRGERALARVLRHAHHQRRQGYVELATTRDSLSRLVPIRERAPARSILRRAAA